ncbi:MAG TPA: oligosaccharide flippase family protein [Bacteroidales bacterium]|nr:oligosaccharide flippase family protein [Bacteroidales bacterium]
MTFNLDRFRRSEFLNNVFTLVSATSVAQGISILIYPVLSRLYSPDDFGLFALYMSITTITTMVATGKYELAVMIPRKDSDGAALSLLSASLAIVFSLLLIVFVAIFHHNIAQWFGNQAIEHWLYFVPASTLLVSVLQISSYWSNRKKIYRRIARANLGQSVVNSGIKLSTAKAISAGGGLIAGALAGQVTGTLWFVTGIWRKQKHHFTGVKRSEMRRLAYEYRLFPRYNMVHYVINNFSTNLPVFVLSSYFGSTVTGLYSLGFMMINRPANLLTSSFTQVFSQRIIEKYNSGLEISTDVKKLVTRLLLLAAGPFVAAAFFGPSLFSFFFGKEWSQAGQFMQILLPWLLVVFVSAPLSFLPDVLSRQRKAMWLDILKFVFRVAALGIGVFEGDVYLALILFSGISFFIVSYNLFWYISLSVRADKRKGPGMPLQVNGAGPSGTGEPDT